MLEHTFPRYPNRWDGFKKVLRIMTPAALARQTLEDKLALRAFEEERTQRLILAMYPRRPKGVTQLK